MNLTEFETYLKERGKKHVIFDFDGTICKLLVDWKNWCREIEALNVLYETGADPAVVGFQEIQNICVKKGGKEARDRITEIGYRNETEYYTGYRLLPVALPLIALAKKYTRLSLWTSNNSRTVLPILAELNIADAFEKIVARNDVSLIKPDPEGFQLMYDTNNPKAEYLIIGDRKADEDAGRNAGIDFINISEFELD